MANISVGYRLGGWRGNIDTSSGDRYNNLNGFSSLVANTIYNQAKSRLLPMFPYVRHTKTNEGSQYLYMYLSIYLYIQHLYIQRLHILVNIVSVSTI